MVGITRSKVIFLFVFEVRQHCCPPYHMDALRYGVGKGRVLRACVRCYLAHAQLHQQLFVCVCVLPRRSETNSMMLYPFMAQWLLRWFVLRCLLMCSKYQIISYRCLLSGLESARKELNENWCATRYGPQRAIIHIDMFICQILVAFSNCIQQNKHLWMRFWEIDLQ